MPVPAPKGLALTGSILSIVVGGLILIGAVLVMAAGRGRDEEILMGIVGVLLGATAVTLGSIGCTIKPGVILANAIVFSVFTLLAIVGLIMSRGIHPLFVIIVLLYVTTTVFLYVGFAQARKYQAAQRGEA